MPKSKYTTTTTTTASSGAAAQPMNTAAPAWFVRYPGATPDRVTVQQASSQHPQDLNIVGAGSRDVVHGHWGHKLYRIWDEAIAASIAQQEAKIQQLATNLDWNREQLARLRTLTETKPTQETR